jgi:hypothetical protein
MDAAGWTISIIAIVIVGILALAWERSERGKSHEVRQAHAPPANGEEESRPDPE